MAATQARQLTGRAYIAGTLRGVPFVTALGAAATEEVMRSRGRCVCGKILRCGSDPGERSSRRSRSAARRKDRRQTRGSTPPQTAGRGMRSSTSAMQLFQMRAPSTGSLWRMRFHLGRCVSRASLVPTARASRACDSTQASGSAVRAAPTSIAVRGASTAGCSTEFHSLSACRRSGRARVATQAQATESDVNRELR